MFGQQNTVATGVFGSSNPIFAASGQQDSHGGFGNVKSGASMFGSGSSQQSQGSTGFGSSPGGLLNNPSFGGTASIGMSGFGGTTPSFGSNNPLFAGPATTASGSAFGAPVTASSVFGSVSSPSFGSPATASTTPSFGSLTSGSPAFGQTGSFGSQNTTFGGNLVLPFGTTTTTTASSGLFSATSNPSFGTGGSIFGSGTPTSGHGSLGGSMASSGQNPFGSGMSSSEQGPFSSSAPKSGQSPFGNTPSSGFGGTSSSKPSVFAPVFGAVGSSAFQPSSTTSLFNAGSKTSSGSMTTRATDNRAGGFSAFAPGTTVSSGIFSNVQSVRTSGQPFGGEGSGFAATSSVTQSSLVSNSTTSTSMFGCISSTGQQTTSFASNMSTPNIFQHATSTGSNIFGTKTVSSSENFNKSESGERMEGDEQDTETTVKKSTTRDEDLQKESRPVRSLFSKASQGEKKLPKSGLFLAAISEIAPKKEQKQAVEKKLLASRAEDKNRDNDDNGERTSSGVSRRIVRRRSTVEDIQKKVAIVVRNVDASCNNKEFLKKYFQKYGTVKRVFINERKHSSTIYFATHDAAQAAKESTRFLKPGTGRVQIFWASHTPRKDSTDSQTKDSTSETKTAKSEVEEELESMQGTSDLYEDNVKLLERTKDTGVDKQAAEKSSRERLGVRTSSGSRIRDTKDRSSIPKLKLSKKSVKTSESEKPKKGADFVSLKSLANCVANTTAERLEVLENRDKLLRMALESKKRIYSATADALIGTCPDMCPEKERYLREFRRHLSVYEIVPGTDTLGQNPKCDHLRAVKEYSRSSADQAMPLPHELRPSPVLSMTMDYLLNNIMDTGGDGKWADWYEFLWSRTRGLRKDITQQDLCDLTSVAVIEKNCRFHIYCAERLCEEDMSTFDEKINNENLTKCLQTLKQMYSDLEKKGIFCQNEGEFRAYIVLMNLNNGDTLREVQQLREEVRESEPVKFATKVYSTLNCNNYIKFFKLVQIAPFLYACILHRYFNQVRSCALRTMLKAYCWRGQSTRYLLSDLVRLLQFENDNEAITFCHHHGFAVEDGKILMDKKAFIEPDTALEPRRAINLIESKQRGTVGEVVNGGPLPPNQLHQPHSSFDENGRFIPTDIQIGEDEKGIDTAATSVAEAQQPSPAAPSDSGMPSGEQPQQARSDLSHVQPEMPKEQPQPQPLISAEVVKDVAKQLFIDVINEHVLSISQSVMRDVTAHLGSDVWIYDELQKKALHQLSRDTAEMAIFECKQEHCEIVARRKAELSAMKAKATESITEELITSAVSQESQSIAKEEYSLVKEQLHKESELRVSEIIAGELVDRSVQEEACLVAEMVFEVDVVERLEEIEETASAVCRLVMARFMRTWKNRYEARQSLKCSILTFPPAPSMKTPSEQVKSLIPESRGIVNDMLHLGRNSYATLDSAVRVAENEMKLSYNITLYKHWRDRRHKLSWSPFCLGSILYAELRCRLRDLNRNCTDEAVYWKLILSLPDVGPNSSMDDDYAQRTITWCDWLRAKFTKGTVPEADPESKTHLLSLYTTRVHDSGTLRVCVRLVKGFPDEDEEELTLDRTCLLGTSAVIFYVGEADPDHGECYIAEVQSRLQHLLENLPKCCPVPLVIMCPNDSPVTEHNLNLELFVQEDMISGYKFVTVGEDVDNPEYHKKIVDSLHWMATYYPEPPVLTSSRLLDTVEDVISGQYFNTVYQTLVRWQNMSQLWKFPEKLITFYNDVISHIADVVSDSALQDLSWPIAEFCKEDDLPAADWNLPDQLDFLHQTVNSLQLPEYDQPTKGDDLEWTDIVDSVWAYVASVAEDGDGSVKLFSRVKYLLHKLQRRFGLESRSCLCLVDWQMVYEHMPWIEIIQACYEQRLCQTSWKTITSEGKETDLMAHYFQSKLSNYTPPQEWIEATRETKMTVKTQTGRNSVSSAKRKLHVSSCDEHDVPKSAKVDTTVIRPELVTASTVTMETENTAHALNCLIAEEKQRSKKFEEFLQKSLQDDDCLNCDINQAFGSPEVFMSVRRKSFIQPQETTANASFSLDGLNSTSANQSSRSTMTDDVNQLEVTLKSQKQANKLFEMQLKSFLID